MKTALVFGASGQIGMPLLERLGAAGWRVLAVSRLPRPAMPGVEWRRGGFEALPPLPGTVDAIFSCGPLDRFAQWQARGAVQAARIVAFGSTSLHSKQASGDAGERELAMRLGRAEALLFESAGRRGVAATVLRPTLVYGSGRDQTLSRIAAIARRAGRFVLPRGAIGRRQPVHVEDLAEATLAASAATAAHGHGYDLPGGETLPYREMVRRVLDCLQPPARLHEVPAPLFGLLLGAVRLAGQARGLGDAAVARMRADLVFDDGPARRDFGYAPRPFRLAARMFASPVA